ncbi:GNAT family N-acetyltransferase [Streptomyces sp. NBC_00893]|uniref:GNAT family N-acetyltransferase n=1 Tax=Streptomyces sp. NBC_00893 TaxID=2975862 RepID=UPI00224F16F4|nr:GNAT family N-acetyltransferase [Streptomyces sp. NBC_00893]MCX4850352.1 hypothetical protein [Streptomyces sp. NBC_00893]
MERDGADPTALGATATAYVKVRALAVADDHRRQGIASVLLVRALAARREHSAFFAYGQFTAGDAALDRFSASRSRSTAQNAGPASVTP